METPSRHSFTLDGSSRVFPIPSPIKGDNYCRLEVDGVIVNDRTKYDIVNNSIVFVDVADVPSGSQLDVLVVQSEEAIGQLAITTNIDIVATNIADINRLADSADEIDRVYTSIDNVDRVSTSADNLDRVHTSIDNLDRVDTSIDKLDRVYTSIANLDRVYTSIDNLDRVDTSIDKLDRVYTSVDKLDRVYTSIDKVDAVQADIANVDIVAGSIAGVNTTSTYINNVNTVATNIADVQTAATNLADISAVADEVAKVITVANDLNEAVSEIDTVANAITNVDNVGNNIANVNAVAGNATNINAAVSNATNINAAVANEANINAAVANETNINSAVSNEANINAAVSNASNINAAVANAANINAAVANEANITTVATNIADVNNFADTYSIGDTAPTSPTIGDLWFDTVNDTMKVYKTTGWADAGSSINGTSARSTFTATAGQTTFNMSYDAGFIDVWMNGVKLVNGTDVTATDGSTIVLTSPAADGDIIDVVAYGTFNLAAPSASQFQFTGGVGTQGTMSWNADEETVDLIQNGATLQLGQETQVHARNNTASTIPNGTVVMATGTLGASGRITIAPYTQGVAVKYILGVTTEDIAAGSDGKVTNFGKVRHVDTSAWNDGDVLFVADNGAMTNVEPATGMVNAIAFVIHAATNGTLMVRFVALDEAGLGGAINDVFYENAKTITSNYTLAGDRNAMTAGPISIADGVTVTISDGATWTVV